MRELILTCTDKVVEISEKQRRIELGKKKREKFMIMEEDDKSKQTQKSTMVEVDREEMEVMEEIGNKERNSPMKEASVEETPNTSRKKLKGKRRSKNTPIKTKKKENWWEDKEKIESKKKEAEVKQKAQKKEKKIRMKELKDRRTEEVRAASLRMKKWTEEDKSLKIGGETPISKVSQLREMFEKKSGKKTTEENEGRKKIKEIMKIFEEEKPEKEKKITGRLGLTNVIGKKRKLEDCMKQDRNDERMVKNGRLRRQEEVEQSSSGRNELCGSNFVSKRRLWSNKVSF